MTADGKIASANRVVSTFSSERDQEHLYELRATADAVMAGARTVDLNEIKLGPGGDRFRKEREKRGLAPYNLRVVVSGSGSIDPKATLFKHRFSPIIVLTTERASTASLKRLRTLADDVVLCGKSQLDFRFALQHLRQKWNVTRLLCEGGGEVNSPLFREGLVDELHLTICPKLMGGRRAATIVDGEGVRQLAGAAQLQLRSFERVGDEVFLVYRAKKKAAK